MTHLVNAFGALGVFLLMIPESACIPLPSEATLLAAGVGVQHGMMSLPVAAAAATAGNLVGSLIAYRLGRGRLVDRLPATVLVRCERLFDRWGDNAVFVARLLPLARTFVSLPAGRAGVPIARFIGLTVAGCAIWSAAFIGAGWAGWQADTGGLRIALLATALLTLVAAKRLAR